MPVSRTHNDPFTDAALRPTSSNATALPAPTVRSQASHHSLRSAASSTTTTRPRQQRDLFAPNLSRRPTSRATPRVEDDVLADSDSERDIGGTRPRRLRRVRPMSPNGRNNKPKQKHEEELEIVNRQPDGSYLRDSWGQSEALKAHLNAPELLEESRLQATSNDYAAIAKQYFATGVSLNGRGSKKYEEEFEDLRVPMMTLLRERALQKLEDEKWRYGPTLP